MTTSDAPPATKTREIIFLALLCAGASALLFTHLTRSYLWNDEGSTALLARTILAHGVPTQYDGPNSTSAEEGKDFTAGGVYRYQPWLQFYLAAASFAVLGESTFSARAPFALCGVLTVLVTYFLGRDLWRNRAVGEASAVILALSAPFLLLCGQSRYYAPCSLFTALALWHYVRLLDARRFAGLWFIIAAILLLHSNHGHAIGLLIAVSLHAAIWRRDRLKSVVGACAVVGLLNLPWLFWMFGVRYGTFSYQKFGIGLSLYTFLLFLFVPHIAFPAVAGIRGMYRWWKGAAPDVPAAHPAGLTLCLVIVMIPLIALFAARPHFRYLSPLLPMGAVFAGALVVECWRSSKSATCAMVVFWLLTGLLPNYLFEFNHEYKGPVGGLVRYLNAHAQAGDLVAIGYEDLPLKFYTKLRVIGGYAGDDMAQASEAKWIIPRKYGNPDLRDRLQAIADKGPYRKIVLEDYPDDGFENRESPLEHNFATVKNQEPVFLYERISP